jgi:hypothetical protein
MARQPCSFGPSSKTDTDLSGLRRFTQALPPFRADVENRPAVPPPATAMMQGSVSALLDQPRQQADFAGQLLVTLHQFLDLADGVQNG